MLIIQLLQWALKIKNQTQKEGNTETLVGGLFEQIVSYLRVLEGKIANLVLSFLWKEPVNTVGELATKYPNPSSGWAVLVKDENSIYCYDGSKWVNTGMNSFPSDVLTLNNITSEEGSSTNLAPTQEAWTIENEKTRRSLFFLELGQATPFKETAEKGFFICDKDGNIAFRIDENGKSEFADLDVNAFSDVIGSAFSITDGELNKVLDIDNKGNTRFKTDKEFDKELGKRIMEALSKFADINHIIGHGQSLAEGSNSIPVLTLAPFSSQAKMFNHGIKTRFAVSPKYQSIVPHIETANAENGETPMAGMVEHFLSLNAFEGKEILSSCCARGGMSVLQLSKGTVWYNNILADVTNGKRLADEQEKSYKVLAVTWTQGEHDYVANTTKEEYKTRVKQLRDDLIADIEAITGDSYKDLKFITYQTSTSFGSNKTYPNIALGQLELALEEKTFIMATPLYFVDYVDNWHIKNFSSKWLGAYYGRALSEMVEGNKFEPLRPISHSVIGNSVIVKFNKSGLKFDKATFLTDPILNKGFNLNNGTSDIITSVELYDDERIKINCSADPTGFNLTYGFQNVNKKNAGELRDSSEGKVTIDGIERNLYNWCVIFERKI